MDSEKTPLLNNNVVISIDSYADENHNYIALTLDELQKYIHNSYWHFVRICCAFAYVFFFIVVLIASCNIAVKSSQLCHKQNVIDNITIFPTTSMIDELIVTTSKTTLLANILQATLVTRTPPVI